MKKRTSLLACAVLLTGCGAATARSAGPATSSPAGSAYPVDVQNCGRTVHLDHAPQRIVSGWPTSTDLLLRLGLGDRVVGQYNTSQGTAPTTVPVISEQAPSREQLLAARPDLVWADGSYLFDGQQLPTIADLNASGVQVMVLSGFCTDDATKATVKDVDTDLAALGRLADVEGPAAALTAEVDRRLAALAPFTQPVPVAVVGQYDGTVYAYDGVYSDMARLAGATNVYAGALPAGQYYSQVSTEDLTKKDPSTLVYLLSAGETQDAASGFLSRTFPTVAAVRTHRVVYLPQVDSTNLAGVQGTEDLAAGIRALPPA